MYPENQNFGKMNNTTEDIIVLWMWTINDSHMMYGSWVWSQERIPAQFDSGWPL